MPCRELPRDWVFGDKTRSLPCAILDTIGKVPYCTAAGKSDVSLARSISMFRRESTESARLSLLPKKYVHVYIQVPILGTTPLQQAPVERESTFLEDCYRSLDCREYVRVPGEFVIDLLP